MTNRSKFLRLFWQQKARAEAPAFTVTGGTDGCEYVVPIPRHGVVQPPRIPTTYRGERHA